MSNCDLGFRDKLADSLRDAINRLHSVVNEEDLTFAQDLSANCRGDLLVVVRADVGEHRQPLLRRGRNSRHLTNSGNGHLEGPRDWCRGHREHVYVATQSLEVLLVLHPEALLLIDDDKTQVFEASLW